VRGARALGSGFVLAVSLAALACASGAPTSSGVAPREVTEAVERVVVVSVSGLEAASLRDERLPTFARIASEGARADGMRGVGAPLVYPAHATLATGRAPDSHQVVADTLLGRNGVREDAPFWHETRVEGDSLLRAAKAAGKRVAAIGWPSTVGAPLELLVPDLAPLRENETWLGVLARPATPLLLAAMRDALGRNAPPWPAASDRDRARTAAACAALRSPSPPQLLLLRLEEPAIAMQLEGIDGGREALARADARTSELVRCLRDAGLRAGTAFAITGDRVLAPVHTRIDPNVLLAQAGWLPSLPLASQEGAWKAIVRATDSLATVHAQEEEGAIAARRILEQAAESTRAFRVLSAVELAGRRGDPRAWFGLEAAPGFVFGDSASGALLRPSERRAAGAAVQDRIAFAIAGAGVRERIVVPELSALDVAPTLAHLLGIEIEGAEGRAIVGVLARTRAAATSDDAERERAAPAARPGR